MTNKHYQHVRALAIMAIPTLLVSCSDDFFDTGVSSGDKQPFEFSATIDQNNETRADESGFVDGDRMGVFVVNYNEDTPGTLTVSSNQVNNVAVSFDAATGKWNAASDIYWLDSKTPADVYGYYPFDNSLSNVETYNFEVRDDQSIPGSDGEMSSYEASDFLWAKAARVSPGNKVNLVYGHILAGVKVILQKGDAFSEEEWNKLPRIVTVDNTLRQASIDLSAGAATSKGESDRNIVMNPESDSYRAVVIPQEVADGKTIIGITIDGINYGYKRDGGMQYTPGKLHTFTIRVDKKEASGGYQLTLVSQSISDWEADQSSHEFEANSYFVVEVPTEGTLKEFIAATGSDCSTIKNLKIKGKLTESDFDFMKSEMPQLKALNLKEAKMVNIGYQIYPDRDDRGYMDDKLPDYAFNDNKELLRLILPDGIKRVGVNSCHGLRLTSTLSIPESVTHLEDNAFSNIWENAALIMPEALEYIGEWAFSGTAAQFDLKLSNTIKHIGAGAFYNAGGARGTFNIPNRLEYLGSEAFLSCGQGLTGDIVVPATIKEIPGNSIRAGFKNSTTLTFEEGVERIVGSSFAGLKFSNHVVFPKSLKYIGPETFKYCTFLGGITIPETVKSIAAQAFAVSSFAENPYFPENIARNCYALTQITNLELDDHILQISEGAFSGCGQLKHVTIGKNVESIANDAFGGCGITNMVCLSKTPPSLIGNPFNFDTHNTVLEVPEGSVDLYRNTPGWNAFDNITAHHELVYNIPSINCLDGGVSLDGILRAEGEWEIAECPDWITVTNSTSDIPIKGTRKYEINVKVNPMPTGVDSRTGNIVFKLKDKDYTCSTPVEQKRFSEVDQDTEIVLQTASEGNSAIPVFIVGDGFTAKDIFDGEYMKRMRSTMEYLFAIEPYKSFRQYFTVTTAVACSPDEGTDTYSSFHHTCFGTEGGTTDFDRLIEYVKKVSSTAGADLSKSLVILVSNSRAFSGSYICDGTQSIAVVCTPEDAYPYDSRGLVQRYAGGSAFAGLGEENVSHFEHIKGCCCPSCQAYGRFNSMKAAGYYANLTMSSKMSDAPWADFIFHQKYSQIVDMWEGGYNHLRGVWRSEANSVMNTYISYYNTISRYTIYKEIMRRSNGTASFDDFVAIDKIEIPQ